MYPCTRVTESGVVKKSTWFSVGRPSGSPWCSIRRTTGSDSGPGLVSVDLNVFHTGHSPFLTKGGLRTIDSEPSHAVRPGVETGGEIRRGRPPCATDTRVEDERPRKKYSDEGNRTVTTGVQGRRGETGRGGGGVGLTSFRVSLLPNGPGVLSR